MTFNCSTIQLFPHSFVASVYKPAFFQCSFSPVQFQLHPCTAMYPDIYLNKFFNVHSTYFICFIRNSAPTTFSNGLLTNNSTISSRLQHSQRFLKNPQHSSSKQLQVAKLPVQWMPFPQYPL